MKTKHLLSTIVIITLSFTGFSQESQTKTLKRISVHDIYIHGGLYTAINTQGSLESFRKLAPGSELLNNDLSSFSPSGSTSFTSNSMLSIMLGFKFNEKEKSKHKSNPILRLGINYSSGTGLTNRTYNESRYPYDTLTSSLTGQSVYIDTISDQNYGMQYESEQLRIESSLIFRTDPEARWSLYSGIGFTFGFSLNATTNIYYHESGRTESRYQNDQTTTYAHFSTGENKFESHRNETNYAFSTYIPLGVDFRIGDKSVFWKRTHVFYEAKPALNVLSIPELYSITNVSLQHGIGVRVTFD